MMKPVEVDVFEFCRRKETLQGEVAVADLPRLVTETVDASGILTWSVQGGHDMRGNATLDLQVEGRVQLQCQRCLLAMPFKIESAAAIVVAADEATADVLDEQLADEPVEVVVGSQAMNLLVLIEDEALLALPPAPRHEACEPQARPAAEEPAAGKKESPFAVLGKLKR